MKDQRKELRLSDYDIDVINKVLRDHGRDPKKHFSHFTREMYYGLLDDAPKYRLTLHRADMENIKRCFASMHAVGTNINQIAHTMNTDVLKFMDSNGCDLIKVDQEKIMGELRRLDDKLNDVCDVLQKFIDKGTM